MFHRHKWEAHEEQIGTRMYGDGKNRRVILLAEKCATCQEIQERTIVGAPIPAPTVEPSTT